MAIKKKGALANPNTGVSRTKKRKWKLSKNSGVVPKPKIPRQPIILKAPAPGAGKVIVPTKFTGAGDAASTATTSNGGGKILRNTKVNLIFWGDAWKTNPAPTPSLNQVINDVAGILSGPYQSRMGQYGSNPAHLGGTFISVAGNNPPSNYTNGNVQNFILSCIENGPLPEPDEEPEDNLHCVFMPPGTNPPPNLGGEHSYASYSDYDFLFDIDINDRSHIAWVAFGSRAFISSVFSHELVEALGDPEGDGIQMNPRNSSSWNEIGDVCSSTAVLNGITVQSYWSQQDKACIVPFDVSLQMEITCIHKVPRDDPYHHISMVGGWNHTENISFRITQLECIRSIDQGNHFFVTGPKGVQTNVLVFAHVLPWNRIVRYIATVTDNTKVDNLLSLPEC